MPEPQPVAESVRLAWPGEAAAVAAVQRRAWHDLPPQLGGALLGGVDEAGMVRAWEQVLSRPADARRRVLVAVGAQGRVVGFATTGPCDDPDAQAGSDGEVDQFWVDPPARRQGHGSRLLNACADTLHADGFARGRWWVLAGDVELRRFLAVAGWEPDGARRTIGAEDGSVTLEQVRLHTGLGDGSPPRPD